MRAGQSTSGASGILNIDKPTGWTSHDVVARVRRVAGQKRVGHAGTLDPLASGVLPVLLGRATRLADFIQQSRKTYLATVQLGQATETDDAEGAVIAEAAVPPLSESVLRTALARFEGDALQTPPRYSAVKIGGQRAYAVARGGGVVELAARPVRIDDIMLREFTPDSLTIEVTCSKGTYIRALARDVARALGTLGHLTALRRTRVGPFAIEHAVSVDRLTASDVQPYLLPASCALPDADVFRATSEEQRRLLNGQPIPQAGLRTTHLWVYDPDDHLVCLATTDGNTIRPRLIL